MSTLQQTVVPFDVSVDRWGDPGADLEEIEHMRVAYDYGYKRGWLSGFVMGVAFVGTGALFVLLVMLSS